MEQIPDDPIIRNCERTGYPDGKEPEYPVCPVCGSECTHVYREDFTSKILGCENCITEEDAWEEPKCFPGKDGQA